MGRSAKIKKSQSSKPINDLPRLKAALENAGGFALHILVCDSATTRRKLLKDLRKKLAVSVVDFKGIKEPVQHILSAIFFSREQEITVVSSLEKFAPEGDLEQEHALFQSLNSRFEEIRQSQRTVLLIISASLFRSLLRFARDVWLHRSGLFLMEDFLVDRYRTPLFLVDHFSSSGEYTTHESKQLLMRVYQELWKEYEQTSDPLKVLYQYDLMGRISRLLYCLGSYQRAMSCLEQQMRLARVLGNEMLFPEILNNTAMVNLARGDYEDALEVLLSAKNIAENVFRGDSHPSKAMIIANLADVYVALGSFGEAYMHARQALRMLEYKLGTRTHHLIPALLKMADAHAARGQYEDGLDCHRRALQLVERRMGLNHPYIAGILQKIGMIYYQQKKPELAQRYVFRNMEIIERTLGAGHPYVGLQLANIGLTSLQGGDPERALKYLSWAVDIRRKTIGTEDPLTAAIYSCIADIYVQRGNADHARNCLEYALQIYEIKLPPGHPQLTSARERLVTLETSYIASDDQ